MNTIKDIFLSLNMDEKYFHPYGNDKAKIDLSFLEETKKRPGGQLILVTAMSPTPYGEGKTTTSIGLGDALRQLGKKTMICLREPSLGPVFGMKGGATGSGKAQVIPSDDINLLFTGDFTAISLAHNLLAALIDNHIYHGNELKVDLQNIFYRRVVDLNDRSLRQIQVGLESPHTQRKDSFDIVAASEVMAAFCLSESLSDLKDRLGNILVALDQNGKPLYAKDFKAIGAMSLLLEKALHPNLVQTLEGTPTLIHGGPFANIAHGCNSIVATRMALKLADYVVTEAGFGSDLGAEKFVNIKCRISGLKPQKAVIVGSLRALKYHGGVEKQNIYNVDNHALNKGLENIYRHVEIVRKQLGINCVVALNRFTQDQPEELQFFSDQMRSKEIPFSICNHWAQGGEGAIDLAKTLLALPHSELKFTYDLEESLNNKALKIAQKIYKAQNIELSPLAQDRLNMFEKMGYGRLPICFAKTPYSFTDDQKQTGAVQGHTIKVKEVRLSAGAGFIVMLCGNIITMPGLPKHPAAYDM